MPRFVVVLGDIRAAIPAFDRLATFASHLILQMRRREAVADPVAFGATPDMTELGTRNIQNQFDAGQTSSRNAPVQVAPIEVNRLFAKAWTNDPTKRALSSRRAVPDREQRSGYGVCIVDVASNVTRQIATWHPKQDRDSGPSSHHPLCHDPIYE